MSYESAPATAMLATHCAACGRPLLDADSVEAGLGPECRKRHGFAKADAEPDWAAVRLHLNLVGEDADVAAPLPLGDLETAEAVWRLGGVETRRFANRLVSRIAIARAEGSSLLPKSIAAVGALGYHRLARVIVERLTTATIELVDGVLSVEAPFNETFLAESRKMPTRRWDGARKRTTFDVGQLRSVLAAIAAAWGEDAMIVVDGRFGTAGSARDAAPAPSETPAASAPKAAPARRIEWAVVGASDAWIDAPYSASFTAELRTVRSRRWDARMKLNVFHPRDLERVLAIARAAFPELAIVEHGADVAA